MIADMFSEPIKTTDSPTTDRCVQLWFGPHLLRSYRANHEAAQAYATAIGRRFPGLNVTVKPHGPTDQLERLPCEQLWTVITP